MNDLEFVPTEHLIEELQRRSSACVVVRQLPVKTDNNTSDFCLSFSGGFNTAIGLAARAQATLLSKGVDETRYQQE